MLYNTIQAFPTIQSPSKSLQVSIQFQLKMGLEIFLMK